MFRGFNLTVSDIDLPNTLAEAGRQYETQKAKVASSLDAFFNGSGSLNAAKMQDNWFPSITADIFISHSHRDLDKAKRLSAWLSTHLGLSSFIDSYVWGHADHLLKVIDDKYCLNPSKDTYSYEKRNRSTSHVHTMLSTALSKMIDNTECLIFLNTPSSISPSSVIGTENATDSPWIYSEIATANYIRKRTPERHIKIEKMAKANRAMALDEDLQIHYPVNLNHLTVLSKSDLASWKSMYESNKARWKSSLDALYALKTV